MGEIQLLGMTHYPPFGWTDEHMSSIAHAILSDPAIPDDVKDPAGWPDEMRKEWGDDGGRSSAPHHRANLVAGLDRVRSALDEFDPDVLVVWGDDQYENFREDLIPAISVLAYSDRRVFPHRGEFGGKYPNYWGEPDDTSILIKGMPDVARDLATGLLGDGFDIAYAYRPLHDDGLAHAFLNTVLFLDHRRTGFPWPMIAMPINCYGSRVISARGQWKPFGEEGRPDPPSPSPRRLMELGAAVARWFRGSSLRVSLVASSSWSHAFLTDHTWRLRADTEADLALYEALTAADYGTWESTTTDEIVHAGQQEVLNWFALMGAARELDAELAWSDFVQTWVFNSNKVFAVWKPTG